MSNLSRIFCVIVFVVALNSLVYEFVFATLLSILFGSVLLHYSLTIGIYMAGMGVGALLCPSIRHKDVAFLIVQMVFIFVGSFGVLSLLFLAQWQYQWSWLVLIYGYWLVVVTGMMSGLQIPLMQEIFALKSTIVLKYDYMGALLGSVLFPFVLYPIMGVAVTLAILILCNAAVVFFIALVSKKNFLLLVSLCILVMQVLLLNESERLSVFMQRLYLSL